MRKKLVLFSDGTGNSSIKAQKTNVWRLFQAVDQRNGQQLALYDDGVGTSSNKYLAAVGLAFGWGLKRNVLDLYKFVCRNFEQRGDERGDDERDTDIYGFGCKTFHPLLWNEADESEMVATGWVLPGRITQVWFAGVHSNLGGGYPEDQLSLVSLDWMIGEAIHSGLDVDQKTIDEVALSKSPYARLYDSRSGISAYYRYAPRQIPILTAHDGQPIRPIVHSSVVMRMVHGSDDYAPISLPRRFWVLAPDGELLPMEGFEGPLRLDSTKRLIASESLEKLKRVGEVAAQKARLQAAINQLGHPESDAVGLVWDTVWWRRAVYFLTVGLTILLALFPAFPERGWRAALDESNRAVRGPVERLVEALSAFVPSYAAPWVDALKAHPVEFAALVAAILFSLRGSTILQARIHDRARLAWHDSPRQGYDAWFVEHERGLRNGTAFAFVIGAALLVTAVVRQWPQKAILEIATITIAGALLLIRRGMVGAKLGVAVSSQGKTLRSTFALRIARKMRTSRWLVAAYRAVFAVAVPIAFAIGLIIVGLYGANRVAFDALNATGYFCGGSVAEDNRSDDSHRLISHSCRSCL